MPKNLKNKRIGWNEFMLDFILDKWKEEARKRYQEARNGRRMLSSKKAKLHLPKPHKGRKKKK